MRFWIAGLVMASGLVLLVVSAIRATGKDYITVAQLKENPERYKRGIKVTGTVVEGTTTFDADRIELAFRMKGEKGGTALVKFHGPRPDAYKDGGVVIVEGLYDKASDTIRAETLLAKCPSRYEEYKHEAKGTSPHEGKSGTKPVPVPER